jgi:hypothetical protein
VPISLYEFFLNFAQKEFVVDLGKQSGINRSELDLAGNPTCKTEREGTAYEYGTPEAA